MEETEINEDDVLAGLEAMADMLSADEEWARHCFERSHPEEW